MKINVGMLTALLMIGLFLGMDQEAFAQSMAKKFKVLDVERVMPFSAEKVWAAVALDYGKIAESHPRIVRSDYEAGSLQGELGAQRMCAFNDKGTQVLHEKIVDWDEENMTFVNMILEAKKFPLDEDNTRAIYKVTPIDANTSKLSMHMEFRTSPAFMGGMMKGSFEKLLNDYMIAVEHNIKTGEAVNRDNFKDIRKQYASK